MRFQGKEKNGEKFAPEKFIDSYRVVVYFSDPPARTLTPSTNRCQSTGEEINIIMRAKATLTLTKGDTLVIFYLFISRINITIEATKIAESFS